MKKRWNIRRLIPVTLLLMVAVTCGAVFAYMFSQAPVQGVQFTPAIVACEVRQTADTDSIDSIKVENTGNIPAYLRVRLVTYYADGENIAPIPPPTLTITPNSGWVAGEDNTFYYEASVLPDSPNDKTPELLTAPIALGAQDGYKQVVTVFAEAIQANPVTAVDNSWPVTMDGTIIKSSP